VQLCGALPASCPLETEL